MGQAMRIIQYDRAANERAAVPALHLLDEQHDLSWFRLDDGVMGGQSETKHEINEQNHSLHFQGTVNTTGGGFASIRSKLPLGILKKVDGVRLRIQGDGKTYKLLLSEGNRNAGAPMSTTPSWQADLPTVKGEWQETVISFDKLHPSFGGSARKVEKDKYIFDPGQMSEIGFMISLRLSDGSANPKETFGEGIFPFSLQIQSIEPLLHSS